MTDRPVAIAIEIENPEDYNRGCLEEVFPHLEGLHNGILANIAKPEDGSFIKPSLEQNECLPTKIVNIRCNTRNSDIPDYIKHVAENYTKKCPGSVVIVHASKKYRQIHPEEFAKYIIWVVGKIIIPLKYKKIYNTVTGTPGSGYPNL